MRVSWISSIVVISIILNGILLFALFRGPLELQDIQAMVAPTSNNCKYKHVNPLRCEPDQAKNKKEYVALRNDLTEYLEEQKAHGKISLAAVYFRDLQNGPVMSINGSEYFIPASLLKIPMMIMYYKKAEDDPNLLQKKMLITSDMSSLPQNIKPEGSAEVGREYTIEELIRLLVTQSDNISWKALLEYLRANYSEEDFVSTLSDLGIIDPRKHANQQYITAQNYASLLRILYNSSYLTPEMSDKALELLSKSGFKDGLEAGTPGNIEVAHKFGEQKNGTEQQLHDCGIVYYPPNPYVLCVMTRGDSLAELETIIQHISKETYEEVTSRNP